MRLLAAERVSRVSGTCPMEARDETLVRWDMEWSASTRGAWTRRLVPSARRWFRGTVELNYWTTQFLTGHGSFGSYLLKMGKRASSACAYCDEEDDPEHTFFVCTRWRDHRILLAERLGGPVSVESVGRLLHEGGPAWNCVAGFVKAILSAKINEERQMERAGQPALPD